MSFGRPPSFMSFSADPPDRGSFPLDHEGECQKFMKSYLKCLKDNQNNNGKCRLFAKDYLECRMQRGLMGEDDFKNLGFQDLLPSNGSTTEASPASQGSGSNAGSKSRSETAAPEAKATGTGAGTGSVGSKVNGSQ